MLYDESMNDTNWILLKSGDMPEIVFEEREISNLKLFIMHLPNDFTYYNDINLVNGLKIRRKSADRTKSNIPLVYICNTIELKKDSISIDCFATLYDITSAGVDEDGNELRDLKLIVDKNMRFVFLIKDKIEKFNADSKLWVELLNQGIVLGDEEELEYYDMLPKTRIYGIDELGKRKIKKFIK